MPTTRSAISRPRCSGRAPRTRTPGPRSAPPTSPPRATRRGGWRARAPRRVTIIGVLDSSMNVSDGRALNGGGLFLDDATFQQLFPPDRQSTAYFVALKRGADAKAVARGIEAALVANGVQALDL